jgi:hypothetical protein
MRAYMTFQGAEFAIPDLVATDDQPIVYTLLADESGGLFEWSSEAKTLTLKQDLSQEVLRSGLLTLVVQVSADRMGQR